MGIWPHIGPKSWANGTKLTRIESWHSMGSIYIIWTRNHCLEWRFQLAPRKQGFALKEGKPTQTRANPLEIVRECRKQVEYPSPYLYRRSCMPKGQIHVENHHTNHTGTLNPWNGIAPTPRHVSRTIMLLVISTTSLPRPSLPQSRARGRGEERRENGRREWENGERREEVRVKRKEKKKLKIFLKFNFLPKIP